MDILWGPACFPHSHFSDKLVFSPPLHANKHLLILSVFPLYTLRPPRELIPCRAWQAVKDGIWNWHAVQSQDEFKIFLSDTISHAHKSLTDHSLLPLQVCGYSALWLQHFTSPVFVFWWKFFSKICLTSVRFILFWYFTGFKEFIFCVMKMCSEL